MTKNYFTFNP